MKTRKPFTLYDKACQVIGTGVAYNEGNVQVRIKPHNTAWQMHLQDVLHLENVHRFQWSEPPQPNRHDWAEGNEVWARIDGAYNPKEFESETS